MYGLAEAFDVETGCVVLWHPAKTRAEVITQRTAEIFILLSFFYSIPFNNDTNQKYFSSLIYFCIQGK